MSTATRPLTRRAAAFREPLVPAACGRWRLWHGRAARARRRAAVGRSPDGSPLRYRDVPAGRSTRPNARSRIRRHRTGGTGCGDAGPVARHQDPQGARAQGAHDRGGHPQRLAVHRHGDLPRLGVHLDAVCGQDRQGRGLGAPDGQVGGLRRVLHPDPEHPQLAVVEAGDDRRR
ncbi:hypothetical protein STANM309S_01386 [Streptomyces tanashiensis]